MAEFNEAQPAFLDKVKDPQNKQGKSLSENKIIFFRDNGDSPSTATNTFTYKDICVKGKNLSVWKKVLYSFKSLTSLKINKTIDQKEFSYKGIKRVPKDKECSNKIIKCTCNNIGSSPNHLGKKYLKMHLNTHSLYNKGSTGGFLYNVGHFSQDRISSDTDTCRAQNYEVERLKSMRLPVVDFPEGNKIHGNTSIDTGLKNKLCKKLKNVSKIDKLKVRRSCNAAFVKSNCVQVQHTANKHTEPCRFINMTNTKNIGTNFESANDQGIKKCQDLKCVYKNKYFQKSHNKKEPIIGNCKRSGANFHKHKKDYSQNLKYNKESNKTCICLNNKGNCRTRKEKMIPLNSIEPVYNKDIRHKNIKYNEDIHPKNRISHQLKKCIVPINIKTKTKYQNCDVNRFKRIKKFSRSDELLSVKKNKSTKSQKTKTCKVINSDINASNKHILYNSKHQRNSMCDKNHTGNYRSPPNVQGYLNVKQQCGDGYIIQDFIKADKKIHHRQNQTKQEKNIQKYLQNNSVIPIQYHTVPGKSCIKIPQKLCKCRRRVCDQFQNKTMVKLPQQERKNRHYMRAHAYCMDTNAPSRENSVCKVKNKTLIKRKCRKKKSKRTRKVDVDYNCSKLLQYTFRQKKMFFIYRMCPRAYPACLNFCWTWKKCTEMMFITCACLIWCPFFFMLEIFRLCFCYFCYE